MFRATNPRVGPTAYLWFTRLPSELGDDHSIFEMHACCRPGWKGKWLSFGVLVSLVGHIYVDLKADQVIALHQYPEVRSVLSRIGFEAHGDFVHILNMEEPNELLERYLRRWRG